MLMIELRDRLIEDGIASAKATEVDEKLEGALEGFEIAKTLDTKEAFQEVLHTRRNAEQRMMFEYFDVVGWPDEEEKLKALWRHRYATLQIEFIFDRMLVAGWAAEGELVSARAVAHVQQIENEYMQA